MVTFKIIGKPDDYIEEFTDANGGIRFKARRDKIRQLVKMENDALIAAAGAGLDTYTTSLDFSDIMHEFISQLPAESQTSFLEVYTQEMDASINKLNDDTEKIIQEIEQKNVSNEHLGQWLGAGVLFILLLFLLFAIK